jgi:hypothetical protein
MTPTMSSQIDWAEVARVHDEYYKGEETAFRVGVDGPKIREDMPVDYGTKTVAVYRTYMRTLASQILHHCRCMPKNAKLH